MALPCHPHRVQEFVVKWRAGVSRLHECQYPISSRLMIQQFVSRLPADSPAFFTLRAGLVSRLQGIADNDFNAFVSLTQEVVDLDNTFRQSLPPRPPNNRNNRGQGGGTRAPNTNQQQQQHGSSSQQTQSPAHPAPVPPSGQPHRDGGQSSNNAHTSKDGGRSGNRRNDHSNHDYHNDNRTFLATMLSEPDMSTSGNQDHDPSVNTLEPTAFLTTLDSTALDLTTIVNDDIQTDLYDPLCSFGFSAMALSPELSNALALIATSPNSKAGLNTVLDSGSTHHIFRDRSAFCTYEARKELSVKTANCGSLVAMGMGTVTMIICLAGRKIELMLQNCLHAPDVPINLFSVGDLQENGFRIHFEPGTTSPYTHVIFPSTHATLPNYCLKAEFIHRLSFLSCDFGSAVSMPAIAPANTRFPKTSLTPSLWHRRLCHPHIDVTRAVLTKKYASGVEFSGTFEQDKCIPCLIGKSPQQPYSNHGRRASRVGELLHMDTCGPFPVATPNGKKYFNTVLDDCSNFGFTTLVAHKSEAVDSYLGTEAHVEQISDQRILSIRIDNAPEFVAGRLGSHFRDRGIMVQAIAPYAHSQNGKIERYIRTLEDGLQTLLADSGLPTSFWGDAVLTVQYLRNRLPTSALPADTTPFEAFYKKKPDISHLRVWGCQCFAIIAPELRSKGGPR